jgi:hypothetical protein
VNKDSGRFDTDVTSRFMSSSMLNRFNSEGNEAISVVAPHPVIATKTNIHTPTRQPSRLFCLISGSKPFRHSDIKEFMHFSETTILLVSAVAVQPPLTG